jgi:hypothetical protein
MTPLRLALALALVLPACRRHRAHFSASSLRWYAHPTDGRSIRLEGERSIHGALRFTESAVAPAPWPATRIAVSARRGDAWLFASEDGTVYRAERFDGPLRVVAELPTPLVAAFTPGYHALRGVHSLGALFAVDVHRRAHVVSFDGRAHATRLERVITGAFGAERVAFAITEPGVLRVSEDGGEHFRAVRAPSGIPLRVNVVDNETFITTTGGVYRWRAEGMTPVDPAPSRDRWVSTSRSSRVMVNTFAMRGFRLPPEAQRVVVQRDGTVTGVAEQTLITIDPAHGRELRREPAPGTECTPRRSGAGVRYICRHDGWAQAVFAKTATGWATLRDEARAEPMGAAVFDDTSGRWAVSAPCTQHPERDPHLVCAYGDDGAHRELRAPFPAEVVAMHDGAILAIDTATSRSAGPTRAVVFRGAEAVAVSLPLSAAAARSVRWEGARMQFWEGPSPAHPKLTLVTGALQGATIAWQTLDAPDGATRGIHGPGDVEIAFGATAAALWQSAHGGAFRRMPSPVRGAGEARPIEATESAYCDGPWCRLGENLTLAFRPAPQAIALARRTPPGPMPAARPREEQRRVYCRLGARSPGPEMDRGIASTGYTLRWQATDRALTVTWAGDALNATVTGTLTARANARVLGRAVPGARAPVGLIEQCDAIGCDDFLADGRGLHPLSLGRGEPGGVEVFEREGGGYLLRFDTTLDDTRITTLVALDASGAERGRRDFVLVEDIADAHVGRFGALDGLWVRDTEGAMRFYALDGDDEAMALTTAPAPDRRTAPCVAGGAVRGTLRMRERAAQVVGDGWFVEAGGWQQEELLELTDAGFCVRSIGGGEARDEVEARAAGTEEHEPVRSFQLSATAEGAWTGRAWQGRERIELTCELREPPSEGVSPGNR